MEIMIWNIVLSTIVTVMGFMLKGKFDELSRLNILLNRTREEIAREHITRKEVDDRIEKFVAHVDQRFNRLELKLDELRSSRTP